MGVMSKAPRRGQRHQRNLVCGCRRTHGLSRGNQPSFLAENLIGQGNDALVGLSMGSGATKTLRRFHFSAIHVERQSDQRGGSRTADSGIAMDQEALVSTSAIEECDQGRSVSVIGLGLSPRYDTIAPTSKSHQKHAER